MRDLIAYVRVTVACWLSDLSHLVDVPPSYWQVPAPDCQLPHCGNEACPANESDVPWPNRNCLICGYPLGATAPVVPGDTGTLWFGPADHPGRAGLPLASER